MMDPRLLDLYNRDRLYMQALSGEFALGHPKIARRLAMLAQETGDPYVNRLIQSSAFVNARMQMRFDDEFPLLTQALLSSVYPGYLSPTPSIAVARFHAGGKAAGFVSGHTLERGAELTAARQSR